MNCRFNFRFTAPLRRAIACALLLSFAHASAQDYPTEINYQGQLYDQGMPVTGVYDMTFQAWDSQAGGMPISVPISVNDVQVLGGQFFVPLDFGADLFGFAPIWVEMTAAPDGQPTGAVTFAPRQKIAAVPMAINSDRVDDVDAINLAPPSSFPAQQTFRELINSAGSAPVVLASIASESTVSGQVLLRGRGHCSMTPLNTNNHIVLAIGTDATAALTDSPQETRGYALVSSALPNGLYQVAWTAERMMHVVAGQQYSFVLAGEHVTGNATSECIGTFTSQFYAD